MINVLLWIGATVAMFHYGEGFLPVFAALVLGAVMAIVRSGRHKRRLGSLVASYMSRYGEAPPGFDITATRVGGGLGGATGHYGVGGLVGAGIDMARMLWNERNMTEEQKALHQQIKGLQAWSPWMGLYVLLISLALSWAALGVTHIVAGG